MASILSGSVYFHDEAAAFAALEAIIWPNGPTCPHCGATDRLNRLEGVRSKPSKTHPEGIIRHGLWKCYHCRGQFTVRKGTVFEADHLKLHQWFQAAFLMCSSKKGVSSNQLHRTLGCTLKTAWFVSHRLREAMREGHLTAPLGGHGKTIEVDETYVGGKEHNRHVSKRKNLGRGAAGKEPVVSLVERGGAVRSHHVPEVTSKNVGKILAAQLRGETVVYADDSKVYHGRDVQPQFRPLATVNHKAGEYVRGDVHTNTVEGYFSILKRGIMGTYHHVSQQHLKRYLAEFDFRYNHRIANGTDDVSRTTQALKGAKGKRLTYRMPSATA